MLKDGAGCHGTSLEWSRLQKDCRNVIGMFWCLSRTGEVWWTRGHSNPRLPRDLPEGHAGRMRRAARCLTPGLRVGRPVLAHRDATARSLRALAYGHTDETRGREQAGPLSGRIATGSHVGILRICKKGPCRDTEPLPRGFASLFRFLLLSVPENVFSAKFGFPHGTVLVFRFGIGA